MPEKRVVNESKQQILSRDSQIADSFLKRMRGLLFTKSSDLVLVSPCEDIASSTIHMFLMTYSLDVIWLDSEKKVVDVKKRIPPFNPLKPSTWKIYRPKEKAKYIIELGEGNAKDTEIGDKISFSD